MKKIIGIAVALLMTTGLFAKTWTNNIGVGFTVPITMMQSKDDIFIESATEKTNKQTFTSFGIQGMYLGYHQSGFTVKGVLDITFGMFSNAYYDDGLQDVFSVNIAESLGIGYSFIHTDKVVLAATGGIGLSTAIVPFKFETVGIGGSDEHDITLYGTTFNLGADLTGIIRTSPKFGFYGSIYVGWIPTGSFKAEDKYEKTRGGTTTSTTNTETHDLNGTVFIAPTIGVVWTF